MCFFLTGTTGENLHNLRCSFDIYWQAKQVKMNFRCDSQGHVWTLAVTRHWGFSTRQRQSGTHQILKGFQPNDPSIGAIFFLKPFWKNKFPPCFSCFYPTINRFTTKLPSNRGTDDDVTEFMEFTGEGRSSWCVIGTVSHKRSHLFGSGCHQRQVSWH